MKKLLFISACLFSFQVHAQYRWQLELGPAGTESYIYSVFENIMGDYVAGGSTGINTSSKRDAQIVIFNTAGQKTAQRNYGGTEDEMFYEIKEDNNGNINAVGYTESVTYDSTDTRNIFYTLVNSTLTATTAMWSIGTPYADCGTGFTNTYNNKTVICGTVNIPGKGKDMLLVKIDSAGNAEWCKTFGGIYNDSAGAVVETPDHGYFIAGYTSTTAANKYACLLKIAEDGTLLWAKQIVNTIWTTPDGMFTDIIPDNGNYTLCGSDGRGVINDAKPSLAKVDTAGNLLTYSSYSLNTGHNYAMSVRKTSGNGYIIGGVMGLNYAIMIRTNSSGTLQWSHFYNNSSSGLQSNGFSAVQTADGGYLLGGCRFSSDTLSYLVKTDFNGESQCFTDTTFFSGTNFPSVQFNFMVMDTASLPVTSVLMTSTAVTSPQVILLCSALSVEDKISNDELTIGRSNSGFTFILKNSNDKINSVEIYNLQGQLSERSMSGTVVMPEGARGIYIYKIDTSSGRTINGKIAF